MMKGITLGTVVYHVKSDIHSTDGINFTSLDLFLIIISILAVLFLIVLPILTVVNRHRVMNGKEPLNKGRVRRIVIVNKRVDERAYFDEGYGAWRFGSNISADSEPSGIARQTSVDFRKVGGQILYTKSIDDELFDQMEVGRTYKVKICDGKIINIY